MTTASTLKFKTLWDNYPKEPPCVTPDGKKAFENQCAIKLGTALARSGVSFSTFKGPRCEANLPANNGMVLRAEELARWLQTRPFDGCPLPMILPSKNAGRTGSFKTSLNGRTGIIFFKDYWKRESEKSPTGDHIDLWNRDRLTPSIETFLRFSLGINSIRNFIPFSSGENVYSDLDNSSQIWFWSLS